MANVISDKSKYCIIILLQPANLKVSVYCYCSLNGVNTSHGKKETLSSEYQSLSFFIYPWIPK